jgi:DNA-binding response OmpR family regulator
MIIDDEYDIVHIVRKHLENWGYSVDTFTDPLFAFQMFKDNPDRYSIILTDIRMPEISGIALAKFCCIGACCNLVPLAVASRVLLLRVAGLID